MSSKNKRLQKLKKKLLVALNAEMGIERPTSKVRSDPVGNITDRFLRDLAMLLSSILTSSEVAEAAASEVGRLPDLN